MAKSIRDILEGVKVKSPDEQRFIDKHTVDVSKLSPATEDDNWDKLNGRSVKKYESDKHGYKDEKDSERVYEEVEHVSEGSFSGYEVGDVTKYPNRIKDKRLEDLARRLAIREKPKVDGEKETKHSPQLTTRLGEAMFTGNLPGQKPPKDVNLSPKNKKSTQVQERKMTSAEKAKEDRLKKKYDPSSMKKAMMKQYGPEEGKSIYFAKLRQMAMEEVELNDGTVVEVDADLYKTLNAIHESIPEENKENFYSMFEDVTSFEHLVELAEQVEIEE